MIKDFPGEHCDRCSKTSVGFIMSMYSEEWICMDCKEKETKRADYQQAVDRDLAAYMDRVRAARGF